MRNGCKTKVFFMFTFYISLDPKIKIKKKIDVPISIPTKTF